MVSQDQVDEALDRQRSAGGRLVENLVQLKHLKNGDFENFIEGAPAPPKDIEATGLGEEFLTDLVLKHLYFAGVVAGHDLGQRIRLPFHGIVEPIVKFLKDSLLS